MGRKTVTQRVHADTLGDAGFATQFLEDVPRCGEVVTLVRMGAIAPFGRKARLFECLETFEDSVVVKVTPYSSSSQQKPGFFNRSAIE